MDLSLSRFVVRSILLAALFAGGSSTLSAQTNCTFSGQNQTNIFSLNNGIPRNANCSDGVRTRTYPPLNGGVDYQLSPPGCDPNVSACSVMAVVGAVVPGNSQNSIPASSSNVTARWKNSGGTIVGQCGFAGAAIIHDQFDAKMSISFQCGMPISGIPGQYTYETTSRICFTTSDNVDGTPFFLDAPTFEEMFCDPFLPPMDPCSGAPDNCTSCVGGQGGEGGSGPGGGAKGGTGGGGAGMRSDGAFLAYTPQGQAGSTLRYLNTGAGYFRSPGAALWRPILGRGWSHDFAERVVKDPDESHVWLILRDASFREFDTLAGGGGLRQYLDTTPSNEFRRLYYDSSTGGFELHDLDGLVKYFGPTGLWLRTVDKNGNTWQSTAYTGDRIQGVTFPDGRSETFAYDLRGKLASITVKGVGGSPTRVWSYQYAGNDLVRIQGPDNRVTVLSYDNNFGYLDRVELFPSSGSGSRIVRRWEYTSHGRVYRSWKGAANFADAAAVDKWELAFDDPTAPTSTTVTDPLGGTSVYTYDHDTDSGNLRVLSIDGACPVCGSTPNTTYTYDTSNPLLLATETDASGIETDFSWNSDGRLASRTEAANAAGDPTLPRVTTWLYDANYPAFVTEIDGPVEVGNTATRVTQMSYSGTTGDLLSRTQSGVEATYGAGTFGLTTNYSGYNSAGRVGAIDPPDYSTTDQTTFTYNVSGRNGMIPDTRTDPLVGTTTFAYDADNRKTAETDPNGVRTEWTYDSMDRVTSVIRRGPNDAVTTDDLITTYTYNTLGDLFCVKDPIGAGTQYSYDAAGRLTEVRRGTAVTTPTASSCLTISTSAIAERLLYVLDGAGHRTDEKRDRGTSSSSWTNQAETAYVYSSMCHLDKTTQAPGKAEESVTEYVYDCRGNLEKVWDPLHPKVGFPTQPSTSYTYDAVNRLVSVSQPWGGTGGGSVTTSYAYDVQDHLVEVIDGNGTSTLYDYSDRDLMTGQISEVSGTSVYAYNDHGQEISETDGRSVTTGRTVDAADRVSLVDYPGTSLDVAYTYGTTPANFDVGRLTGVTRNGSTISYAYDRFGRTLADGGLTYTYDNNGNPLTIAYPGTLQAIYTYDKMNRPISLQSKEGAAAAVYVVKNSPAPTYKAYGPLNTLVFNTTTNRTETRNFDFRYQPTGVTLSSSILTWTIAVDAAGNVTQQQRTAPAPTETRTYGYQDWQYYLASGAGPWSGSPLSWTYDKIGNRMSETRGGLSDGYVYADNSGSTGDTALLDVVNLGVGGTRDYTFDGGGYLGQISAGANVLAYTFDAAGELASVVRGGQSLTNTYDGRGFLSQASDGTSGGYVKPTYSSAGLLLSQERLPSTGGTTERIDVLYFAGRPAAIWKKVGAAAATTTYLTTDQLGAPMFALNPAGTELWKGGFEPFGRDWQEGTANDALTKGIFLRLPGQWDDTLFGNATLGADSYYNVRRWYEQQLGRYESKDPLGPTRTRPFLYARSSPLVWTDPFGLFVIDSSCDCFAPPDTSAPGYRLDQTIKKACGYLSRPGCRDALRHVSGSFEGCFDKQCREGAGEGITIRCNGGTGNCGETSRGGTVIFLYRGHAGCPRRHPDPSKRGPGTRDYSQTLFHEMGHPCGISEKEENWDASGTAESVCTGWPE